MLSAWCPASSKYVTFFRKNICRVFSSAQPKCSPNVKKESPDYSFRHAKTGTFLQEKPVLHNPYLSDALLQSFLRRHIASEHFHEINDDLARFGERICNEIDGKGLECELNPPTLTHFDAWGKRIDRVNTCDAWKSMKTVSAEEGLIAIGYERNYGQSSRIYQMAKLFLFGSSSGLYSCPLAMTDGAAKVLETLSPNVSTDDGILGNAYRRLTSRDPAYFWTSGQWMTEKRGGSDVANATETVAYKQHDGSFKLYGYKWFTSATDADMVLTLARISDETDVCLSSGLSLFFLETKCELQNSLPSGLNGLQVQRLKDKLGTRQLPTAEMLLDGTVAYHIGAENHGIRNISSMLTITRLYNSLMGLSGLRRIVQLAIDYSCRRTAFGTKLANNTLHLQTVARMNIEYRAAFLLTFDLVRILGMEESGTASDEDLGVMRLMTPICKLYTAKQALKVCSEGLEAFGGMGYLEDSGLPRILRDAQVLSIWEGTTNVLALDVLRAISKSNGEVVIHFFSRMRKLLDKARSSGKLEVIKLVEKVETTMEDLSEFVYTLNSRDRQEVTNSARDLSYSFAKIYMAALLLDHATWDGADKIDMYAAKSWCMKDLCSVSRNSLYGCYAADASAMDREMLFQSYQGSVEY